MVRKERLIRLTKELIRIDSQNPPGDECRIAEFVHGYLKKLGLPARIYEFKKRRSNVVATLRSKSRRRSLLITPHLDTVPSGNSWHFDPFAAKLMKQKIYGLGATDCKGNLASAMEAINSMLEDGVRLKYNLIFAATADEESGSALGLAPLLKRKILKPDAALVLDADDFHIVIAQKGLIHLTVRIKGKRAHGAYPWLGKNAVDSALKILRDIKLYRFGIFKNRYLRAPTVNIGVIRGGDKVNVVADWCEFELDIRFLPGMSAGKILKDLKGIIRRHSRQCSFQIQGIQQPYVISATHPLVSGLSRSMRKIGIRPLIRGSEGATTISFFQEAGIPAVATGFGCAGCAHIADEYIKIASLYKGTLALEYFLKNYKPV
ncbi:MAG: M20 family metallopeptidase [Candidatus Omnitrophota bacterium]